MRNILNPSCFKVPYLAPDCAVSEASYEAVLCQSGTIGNYDIENPWGN